MRVRSLRGGGGGGGAQGLGIRLFALGGAHWPLGGGGGGGGSQGTNVRWWSAAASLLTNFPFTSYCMCR